VTDVSNVGRIYIVGYAESGGVVKYSVHPTKAVCQNTRVALRDHVDKMDSLSDTNQVFADFFLGSELQDVRIYKSTT
jgi:hypothetical protein